MYPPATRFAMTVCPPFVGSDDAPTTAIELGVSSRAVERASARCSREAITDRDRSVGSIEKSRATTPSSKRRATS